MADDAQEIIGKWTVRVMNWVWEYEFSPGGKVTWRDTRSSEKGVGRWALSPKSVNISWSDSATTESWLRPLTPAKQKGWYNATYYTGNYEMQKVVAAVATASQAGKAIFATMDQCGIAALDEILSRSISEGMEYSGLIFKQGAKFGFTAPVRGERQSALQMLIVPAGGSPADIEAAIQGAIKDAKQFVPAGTDPVGTYHTHGNMGGAGEIFSPQDRAFHNLRHWFAYLGTPSRAILRLTPKDRPAGEDPAWAAFGGKAEKLR
jgi:hypothetical protein